MRINRKIFVLVVVLSCFLTLLLVFKVEYVWRSVSPTVNTKDINATMKVAIAEHRLSMPTAQPKLPPCENVSSLLVGASPVNLTAPTWEELEHTVLHVTPGGVYTPPDCTPRESIVLVIPYRDREEHLRTMLRHIHPFLQRQQAHYAILVVEETKSPLFNKGITMNIGFLEAVKRFDPDCVIFHDVDQLPKDDRNKYRCEEKVLHLAVLLSQYDYRLQYKLFFGGAIAATQSQFEAVNGFSTEYYGWGQEDVDMLLRVQASGVGYTRHDPRFTLYASVRHEQDTEFIWNPHNGQLLKSRRDRKTHLNRDLLKIGLNTTRYTVRETLVYPLYTHVKAEAETPLMNYNHATDVIPCMADFVSRSARLLVQCATECNSMGEDCRGFVYDFKKGTKYTCYLKGKMCNTTEISKTARFFMKAL